MPTTTHRSAGGAASGRTLPAALRAHCWRPGQSGNPGGQTADFGEALRLARQAAPDAVRRLIELMDSDDGRVAAVACNAILDRALGKPRSAPDELPPDVEAAVHLDAVLRNPAVIDEALRQLAERGLVTDAMVEEVLARGPPELRGAAVEGADGSADG
jgi:hypothetical protein